MNALQFSFYHSVYDTFIHIEHLYGTLFKIGTTSNDFNMDFNMEQLHELKKFNDHIIFLEYVYLHLGL